MTGMQALVRLPIQQRLRDAAAGLNTGGYISGYRGSPLGRYDIELWRAGPILARHNIVFRPGLNEDLAATAIWGAQHVASFPGATVDGVFGVWYGKGPGVDRSGDALRHANFTGTAPKGGALALAGDDHGAKSSTAVNFSDTSFVAVGMPVLYPSNTQELIDFGLHGIAMSRFSGCWVGMKVVTDVAEGGGTVYVGPDSPPIVIPERPSKPAGGVSARSIDMPLMQEERLYNHKLPAALAYARANELNRVVGDSPNARVGVVAAGKAWQDLLQALGNLGLNDNGAALGLAPVESRHGLAARPGRRARFRPRTRSHRRDRGEAPAARGSDPLDPLRGGERAAHRRQIFRRADLRSGPWRAGHPELRRDDAGTGRAGARESVGRARSGLRLERARERRRKRSPTAPRQCEAPASAPAVRTTDRPAFPKAAARSPASAATPWRCYVNPMQTTTVSHMGGEGAMWLGQQPFTRQGHVFANLGDGTYAHSGVLAVRQAVAANVPITYKILYNGFVSMTGGQPIEGGMSPVQILAELAAEGVKKLALVADDPDRYVGVPLPPGVVLRHRDAMDEVQREFREFKGVSVILYDQPCATERRRLRKRGKWADPAIRTFIHPEVCEGCGDCGRVSELHGDRAARDRMGPQAAHKPVELQQGFLLRRGLLPELRDRPRRAAAQARRRRAARTAAGSRADPARDRRALERARRGHRRLWRRHGQPDAGGRRLSRRALQHQSRPHRPQPEIRRRHRACAPGASGGGSARHAHRLGRGGRADRLRPHRRRGRRMSVEAQVGHAGRHRRGSHPDVRVRAQSELERRQGGTDRAARSPRSATRRSSSTDSDSPRSCSATRSPRTCSCWGPPGRKASCRSGGRRSSGRSSSTASRSRPTSRRSNGAGAPRTTSPGSRSSSAGRSPSARPRRRSTR